MKNNRDSCYLILLESATDSCSVALANGEDLVDEKYLNIPKIHDKMMASLVERILKENHLSVSDCKAVAISGGPGSYMGLRISSSIAKGLAYGASINLISVNTLSVIAQCAVDNHFITDQEKIVVMLDAGRMEVYCATYDLELNQLSRTNSLILTPESFAKELSKEKILFTGNGIAKFEKILRGEKGYENATFKEQLPHASGIRREAFKAVKNSKYESIAYYEPFYLKDFIPGKPKKLLLKES